MAMFGILCAGTSVMADTRERPHVVQCPNNRLAGIENFFQVLDREHTLINPMQVYYISLLKLGQ